jgi:hypothetical protein
MQAVWDGNLNLDFPRQVATMLGIIDGADVNQVVPKLTLATAVWRRVLIEPIGSLNVAKKSKKAKRGTPAREKKGMKKATPAKKKKKKPVPKPAPVPIAPLVGSFGGKTED